MAHLLKPPFITLASGIGTSVQILAVPLLILVVNALGKAAKDGQSNPALPPMWVITEFLAPGLSMAHLASAALWRENQKTDQSLVICHSVSQFIIS